MMCIYIYIYIYSNDFHNDNDPGVTLLQLLDLAPVLVGGVPDGLLQVVHAFL